MSSLASSSLPCYLLYFSCLFSLSLTSPAPHILIPISLQEFNMSPPAPPPVLPNAPSSAFYLPECMEPLSATFFPQLFDVLHRHLTTAISETSTSPASLSPLPSSSSTAASRDNSTLLLSAPPPLPSSSSTAASRDNSTLLLSAPPPLDVVSYNPGRAVDPLLQSGEKKKEEESTDDATTRSLNAPPRGLVELNWASYGGCMAVHLAASNTAYIAATLISHPLSSPAKRPNTSLARLLCQCAEKFTLNNPTIMLVHLQSQCRIINAVLTGQPQAHHRSAAQQRQ
eukprot:GHVS01018923.1.p1 GENE.GHVS01018923.1~~GHVS01018923.1.p1  ORF type:complete len:284 (-),score=57.81 GHVS01018923.1:766-1617(-)